MSLAKGCAPVKAPSMHATLESWTSDSESSALAAATGLAMAEDLGSMGYDGIQTIFLSNAARVAAMSAEGLALEYYKSYNKTWHSPWDYFANYASIPTDTLLACGDTRFNRSDYATLYLQADR